MHKYIICDSPKRGEVDRRLRAREPMRVIAGATGFSKPTIGRHSIRCLSSADKPIAAFDPALQKIISACERALRRAEKNRNPKLMLEAAKQLDALRQQALLGAPPRKERREVTLRVVYDPPTTRAVSLFERPELIRALRRLVEITKDDKSPFDQRVGAYAARLALLLEREPIPVELDRALAEAEAALPAIEERKP